MKRRHEIEETRPAFLNPSREPQAWLVDLCLESCLTAPPGGKSGQEHGSLPGRFLEANTHNFILIHAYCGFTLVRVQCQGELQASCHFIKEKLTLPFSQSGCRLRRGSKTGHIEVLLGLWSPFYPSVHRVREPEAGVPGDR